MATSFEEIYCLNSVIKIDQRLTNKPSYMQYLIFNMIVEKICLI